MERNALNALVVAHTFNPCLLDGDRVTTDFNNFSVDCLKLIVMCAEPAHLIHSATSKASRMKTDNHRLTTQFRKCYLTTVRVKREIRGLSARS